LPFRGDLLPFLGGNSLHAKNALKKATRSTKQLKKQTNLMSCTVYIYLGGETKGNEITHYYSL